MNRGRGSPWLMVKVRKRGLRGLRSLLRGLSTPLRRFSTVPDREFTASRTELHIIVFRSVDIILFIFHFRMARASAQNIQVPVVSPNGKWQMANGKQQMAIRSKSLANLLFSTTRKQPILNESQTINDPRSTMLTLRTTEAQNQPNNSRAFKPQSD